jgi:hypothetical protein
MIMPHEYYSCFLCNANFQNLLAMTTFFYQFTKQMTTLFIFKYCCTIGVWLSFGETDLLVVFAGVEH